jgi:predicted nucleotidyltransferase component of viral defense system
VEHILSAMLKRHAYANEEQFKHALKEVIQEIALFALSKTDFFQHVSFYGGSALRIFHGLRRFSEDLDFSLDVPNPSFDLNKYFHAMETTFRSYGLNFQIKAKEKTTESFIRSAFLKGNTLEHLLLIEPRPELTSFIQKSELIQIKLEIDTSPPPFASYEYRYGLDPLPYRIRLYDPASLLAGKLHAVLCRQWKHRIKGRDLYDYVFFLSQGIPVNLAHLKMRLVESKRWHSDQPFTLADLKRLLHDRFASLDYGLAKEDVVAFIADPSELELWSAAFFQSITDRKLTATE